MRRRFLDSLNPLAKLLAPVPAIVVLLVLSEPRQTLLFALAAGAVSYLLLIFGTRLVWPQILLLLALPLIVGVTSVTIGVWASGETWWDKWQGGVATSLRLVSVIVLFLPAGMSTTGPDLVRASVQQLHVPYRVGWTMLASLGFVPRFRTELETIRAAHRVRGVERGTGYLVPLLAGGLRHAERVSLAMDARAFGAYPTRTERHLVPWRVRDTVFVVLSFAATALAAVWIR